VKYTYLGMALLLSLLLPVHLLAGQSSAILGTEGWFAGALPPPGFHFINYLAYVAADELKDSSGNNVPLDFDATIVAEVLRGIYVSDVKVLGGDLACHVVVPLVYRDVELEGTPGGAGDFDEDEAGLGDIYVSPLILGWHSDIFHWVFGLDIITPTGEYDEDKNVNIGTNHWTFEPAVAVSMIHPSGLSASVKLMYDIHTENDDTKLLTGQQIHLDYNAGYQIADSLRLGVCGFILKGLEDDELDGESRPDSKQQVFAIGPSAMYSLNPGCHLVAKAQFEMEAENRPEGYYAWLKLPCCF